MTDADIKAHNAVTAVQQMYADILARDAKEIAELNGRVQQLGNQLATDAKKHRATWEAMNETLTELSDFSTQAKIKELAYLVSSLRAALHSG